MRQTSDSRIPIPRLSYLLRARRINPVNFLLYSRTLQYTKIRKKDPKPKPASRTNASAADLIDQRFPHAIRASGHHHRGHQHLHRQDIHPTSNIGQTANKTGRTRAALHMGHIGRTHRPLPTDHPTDTHIFTVQDIQSTRGYTGRGSPRRKSRRASLQATPGYVVSRSSQLEPPAWPP